VRAAVVRVVEHVHVARACIVPAFSRITVLMLSPIAAQVHRHVRRVGDQVALGVEQRAAEVQPLLDVDRVGGVLQLQAHLLGDVHEQVVEHLQQHRVGGGARRVLHGAGFAALQHQMVQRGQLRLPAGLDHGGGVLLGNDGRAVDHVAGAQVLAHDQRRHRATGRRSTCARCCGAAPRAAGGGVARLRRRIARPPRPRPTPPPHQALALHQEGKALAVGGLEAAVMAASSSTWRAGAGTGLRPTTTSAESVPS
jgi:hypothetical protein